jgi:hypothetical protein
MSLIDGLVDDVKNLLEGDSADADEEDDGAPESEDTADGCEDSEGDWWDTLVRRSAESAIEAVKEATEKVFPPPKRLEDLLASFEIDNERSKKEAVIYWNTLLPVAAAHEIAEQAKDDIDAVRADQGDPQDDADAAADAALGEAVAALDVVAKLTQIEVPPDVVHVSDAAIAFKSWHLKSLPPECDSPYKPPIDDPTIVANVKKARAMLQPIPHGDRGVQQKQFAGTMAWTKDNTGSSCEGWMYVEPSDSEYSREFFWPAMEKSYKDRADEYDRATAVGAKPGRLEELLKARRQAAAVEWIIRQEGLPSSINTWDSVILTWCSGLASAGKLNEVFYPLSKDPIASRVMYLCGFLYDGFPGPFDAVYQIVDVVHGCVVYRDQQFHKTVPGTSRKKGDRDWKAWKELRIFTGQIELIYMLIALARDPLTRQKVFDVNYGIVSRMVDVMGAEYLATEALYVFIAEVQHNWAINDHMVNWTLKHRSSEEMATTSSAVAKKSPERDQAVAKGVFRYVLGFLQEQAYDRAYAQLQRNEKKAAGGAIAPVNFATMFDEIAYGVNRLFENYWRPMTDGSHAKDGSTVEVKKEDFPAPDADPKKVAAGHCAMSDKNKPPQWYDLGPEYQCDFLFPHNNVKLIGFRGGNVLVEVMAMDGSEKKSTITVPPPPPSRKKDKRWFTRIV